MRYDLLLSENEVHPDRIVIRIGEAGAEDVSAEEAHRTEQLFAEKCPGAEISLLPGGQPVYYYIVSME